MDQILVRNSRSLCQIVPPFNIRSWPHPFSHAVSYSRLLKSGLSLSLSLSLSGVLATVFLSTILNPLTRSALCVLVVLKIVAGSSRTRPQRLITAWLSSASTYTIISKIPMIDSVTKMPYSNQGFITSPISRYSVWAKLP